MRYISTRDSKKSVSSAEAIANGIASDGGLFVPTAIPKIDFEKFIAENSSSYQDVACGVLELFLTDFDKDDIKQMVTSAYSTGFDSITPAPLKKISNEAYVLELWHGPTCAFKDMALQLLPHLMVKSAEIIGDKRERVVLVATSGDTGKAALDGFSGVYGTKIAVFYPQNGVSHMQKLQMNTQEGENVFVSAINGNFDDAQTAVKKIFASEKIVKLLNENGKVFSSANSINWGRLVPQIIYYVSSYIGLKKSGICTDLGFNVVVPTGNFGNILAAYYAKHMGVPINKLICASNKNNILTDFINSGEYNVNREFFATNSPSMDILVSSNLERLLYHISAGDTDLVGNLMSSLTKNGKYIIPEVIFSQLKKEFYGGYCDEISTANAIKSVFEKYNYLIDTHTAVAMHVYDEYVKTTGDNRLAIIASTASPYKFPSSVLSALEKPEKNEFLATEKLHNLTKTTIPKGLVGLENKKIRFNNLCEKTKLEEEIELFLKI